MNTKQKMRLLLLATMTGISGQIVAMVEMAAPKVSAPVAPKKSSPLTTKKMDAVKSLENTSQARNQTQNKYFTTRAANSVFEAIAGKSGPRDTLTNQKIRTSDLLDVNATPETKIEGLELKVNENNNFDASRSQRSMSDFLSNATRNLTAKELKVTKQVTEKNKALDTRYSEFTKPGDKITETWSRDKTQLLETKISSPDGSYRIINNRPETPGQGKIVEAKDGYGRTVNNEYNSTTGLLETSTLTTPRSYNIIEPNNMQTRQVTEYNTEGTPTKTITYQDSLYVSNISLSTKTYDASNPLQFVVKDPAGNVLEVRTQDASGNLTTYVPSTGKKAQPLPETSIIDPATNQPITPTGNFAVKSTITFTNGEISNFELLNPKTGKPTQTINFNKNGSVSQSIIGANGKETTITAQNDQLYVDIIMQNPWDGAITKYRSKTFDATTGQQIGRVKKASGDIDFATKIRNTEMTNRSVPSDQGINLAETSTSTASSETGDTASV